MIDTASGNPGAPGRDWPMLHRALPRWAYGTDLAVRPERLNSQLADKHI